MTIRKGYHEYGFVEWEGKLAGVALGYDFTTEHQCGIEKIKADFGVGKLASLGLESRQVTSVPRSLFFEKTNNEALLLYVPYTRYIGRNLSIEEHKKEAVAWAKGSGELNFFKEENYVAAWSDNSFAIRVRSKEQVSRLESIYNSFLENRIIIGIVPAKVWTGSGLAFFFAEAFQEEQRKQILKDDKSHAKLLKLAAKLDIKAKIAKAGLRFFALTPKWADEEKEEIKFWLNPMEQHKYNAGWVSLADLEAWTRGEGPIVKCSSSS